VIAGAGALDVLFLHEAIGIDIPETRQFYEQMHDAQKCRCFGAAISDQKTDIQFGNAIQLGFGSDFIAPPSFENFNVRGVLKGLNLLEHPNYASLSAMQLEYFDRKIDSVLKLYVGIQNQKIARLIVSVTDSKVLQKFL